MFFGFMDSINLMLILETINKSLLYIHVQKIKFSLTMNNNENINISIYHLLHDVINLCNSALCIGTLLGRLP